MSYPTEHYDNTTTDSDYSDSYDYESLSTRAGRRNKDASNGCCVAWVVGGVVGLAGAIVLIWWLVTKDSKSTTGSGNNPTPNGGDGRDPGDMAVDHFRPPVDNPRPPVDHPRPPVDQARPQPIPGNTPEAAQEVQKINLSFDETELDQIVEQALVDKKVVKTIAIQEKDQIEAELFFSKDIAHNTVEVGKKTWILGSKYNSELWSNELNRSLPSALAPHPGRKTMDEYLDEKEVQGMYRVPKEDAAGQLPDSIKRSYTRNHHGSKAVRYDLHPAVDGGLNLAEEISDNWLVKFRNLMKTTDSDSIKKDSFKDLLKSILVDFQTKLAFFQFWMNPIVTAESYASNRFAYSSEKVVAEMVARYLDELTKYKLTLIELLPVDELSEQEQEELYGGRNKKTNGPTTLNNYHGFDFADVLKRLLRKYAEQRNDSFFEQYREKFEKFEKSRMPMVQEGEKWKVGKGNWMDKEMSIAFGVFLKNSKTNLHWLTNKTKREWTL